ncbi:hypothetical protein T484DRAFT_1866567, partial [Baffinella frigidus]
MLSKVVVAGALIASASAFAPSGTTVLRAPAKSAVCGVTMAAEKKDAGLTRRAALGLAPALAGLVFAKSAKAYDFSKIKEAGE